MINPQLKFALFPVKYILSTTLIHKKYILYPTQKGHQGLRGSRTHSDFTLNLTLKQLHYVDMTKIPDFESVSAS